MVKGGGARDMMQVEWGARPHLLGVGADNVGSYCKSTVGFKMRSLNFFFFSSLLNLDLALRLLFVPCVAGGGGGFRTPPSASCSLRCLLVACLVRLAPSTTAHVVYSSCPSKSIIFTM